MKKVLVGVLAIAGIAITTIADSTDLAANGSFENKGSCHNYSMLQKKGFKLNFSKKDWLKKWVVNPSTPKAEVAIVPDNAPDGKQYLEIKNGQYTHVYQEKKLPGEFKYEFSFLSKGSKGNDLVEIIAYVYDAKTHRYMTGKAITKIKLGAKWQKYSVKIPELGSNKEIMLVFSVKGDCCLDNVKLFMQE
jgi:hypothetical protein